MSRAIKCDICGSFDHQDYGTYSDLIHHPLDKPPEGVKQKNIWMKVISINGNATNQNQEITVDLCFNCANLAIKQYLIQLSKLFKENNREHPK